MVAVMLTAVSAMAQQRRVYGTVTDEHGEPLPGVVVCVTGNRTRATHTDEQGRFLMENLSDDTHSLTFTMMGMKEQTVSLGQKDKLSITMHETSSNLQEVVITGYQKIDKRYSTSAVSSIDMKDLNIPESRSGNRPDDRWGHYIPDVESSRGCSAECSS